MAINVRYLSLTIYRIKIAEEEKVELASAAASSGARKIDGVELTWNTSGIKLTSKDRNKILNEARSIREALLKSPLLKDLAKDVVTSQEDTHLDLSAIVPKINARLSDPRCNICFSLPLCFYGKRGFIPKLSFSGPMSVE